MHSVSLLKALDGWRTAAASDPKPWYSRPKIYEQYGPHGRHLYRPPESCLAFLRPMTLAKLGALAESPPQEKRTGVPFASIVTCEL